MRSGSENLLVAINISPRQFREENFLEAVLAVLAETGLILATVDVPTLLVTLDRADRAAFPERVARIEHGRLLNAAS